MDHGCVDVGLLVEPFDREKYESLPIGKPSRMGVYMRADDPLAKKPEVWMQDLEGRPLLRGLRPDLDAMLFARHTDQDSHSAMIESDLPTNLAIMVDEGMGYFISGEGYSLFLMSVGSVSDRSEKSRSISTHFLRGAEISPSVVSRKHSLSF